MFGVVAKLILNIALIQIPCIGVNGAAIGTIVCNAIACIIGFSVLKKNIDIKFSFSKYIFKPVIATIIMSVCSYAIYLGINSIFPEKVVTILDMNISIAKIATILAIGLAVIIYALAIVALKIFTKEEIYMIPYGQKIYRLLVKFGIYKEEKIS